MEGEEKGGGTEKNRLRGWLCFSLWHTRYRIENNSLTESFGTFEREDDKYSTYRSLLYECCKLQLWRNKNHQVSRLNVEFLTHVCNETKETTGNLSLTSLAKTLWSNHSAEAYVLSPRSFFFLLRDSETRDCSLYILLGPFHGTYTLGGFIYISVYRKHTTPMSFLNPSRHTGVVPIVVLQFFLHAGLWNALVDCRDDAQQEIEAVTG